VGLDEEKIRKYVKYQEEQEKKEEAQQLGFDFQRPWVLFQSHLLRRWILTIKKQYE